MNTLAASTAPAALALRDYQADDVRKLRNCYSWGNRAVCYQLPTGAGKTIVFSYIVSGAVAKGRKVAVVVHRRELIHQASAKLTLAGVAHGIMAAGQDAGHDEPVQVCSIQSIANRLDRLPQFGLIVLDECRHCRAATWAKFLASQPGAHILGVSATPARLDGKGLGKTWDGPFDALVTGPTVQTLIDAGHLAPTRCFVPARRIDTSGLRKVAGDFAAGDELARRASVVTGDAVKEFAEKAPGKSAIAFCVTVEHAEDVAREFAEAGYRTACVHGATPKDERDAMIRGLGDGSLDVLTSCEVISEGLDVPSVGAVLLLRPTGSLTVYLQQVGRGMRPKANGEPLIILDHAGNSIQHGLPEDDRLWSLDGVTRDIVVRKPADPETIGMGVPREIVQLDGVLVEAGKGDALDRWRNMTYAQFKKHPRTEQQIRDFGRAKGYKKGFAWAFSREQRERFGGLAMTREATCRRTPGPSNGWPRFRRMHAAGCTDREISLALAVTPRAVTGKRQRLGLINPGLSSRDAYEASLARAARRKRAPSA